MENKNNKRVTYPYLSKYERARILGTRALQISNNAPVFVDPQGETEPFNIALMELNKKVIPIKIKRTLPDGSFEIWKITELTILH